MRGPIDPEEMRAFFASFFYDEAAFLVDEVVRVDGERHEIEARLDTTRVLPTARHQRVSQAHPAHVSGPDLLMVTTCLGSLHAWFFHGVRWDEGWVGYGSRIHWAEFRHLAHADRPSTCCRVRPRCGRTRGAWSSATRSTSGRRGAPSTAANKRPCF
jgi:hypothetical protein